jgi:hypothetical protein
MEKTVLKLGKQSMIFTVKDKADEQLDAYEAERDVSALVETDIGDAIPHATLSLVGILG